MNFNESIFLVLLNTHDVLISDPSIIPEHSILMILRHPVHTIQSLLPFRLLFYNSNFPGLLNGSFQKGAEEDDGLTNQT